MSDVPSDLYREILVLLPAESLFRFRSVCKAWLRIIDDPSFIKEHTKNQLYNHTLVVRNGTETGAPLYSFSLDSLNFMNGPQVIDATRIANLSELTGIATTNLIIEASCHGLILISDTYKIDKILIILNPLTKECRKLPEPHTHDASRFIFCGFGYDSDSDDYKVVRIDKLYFPGGKIVYQTLIYSLKSDSWRKVKNCPCDILRNGVFLDGVVYWSSLHEITALDLRTERYCQPQLRMPPKIRRARGFSFCFRLDALDGCLICTRKHHDKKTLDAWVMKDNRWIKLFSLENIDSLLCLVAYSKRKGQVLLHDNYGFLWFDIQNNLSKQFYIDGFLEISSSRICPGSLVRLNGAGHNGLGVVTAPTTLTPRKRTRLKFCVRNAGEMCCSYYRYYCRENFCWRCYEE